MIAQVDDALCEVVGRLLPPGTAVRLDAPKPTWQTESGHLSVDLFLFGLHAGAKEGATRRYVLSYLVTARADKIQDEHALLDRALSALLLTGALRVELRQGKTGRVSLCIADTDPAGLWTSLGVPARAGFVVAVAVPVTG
jgi:hypothetical protein